MSTTYRVSARRWEHGWELHISGVGVTQSRTLAGAKRMVRDYLALDLGGDPDSYDVDVEVALEGELEAVAEARRAVRRAEQELQAAAAQSRKVAQDLRAAGLSGPDIATVMGVSTQRVSQLMNS